MILLAVMNLSGTVKISVMVTVIYGIKIILTIHQSSWFFSLKGNFKNYRNRICCVHLVMLKKSNQERDQLLAVTSMRSIVWCIHMLVLKKQGLEGLYLTQIVNMVHTVTLGMTSTTPLTMN